MYCGMYGTGEWDLGRVHGKLSTCGRCSAAGKICFWWRIGIFPFLSSALLRERVQASGPRGDAAVILRDCSFSFIVIFSLMVYVSVCVCPFFKVGSFCVAVCPDVTAQYFK